MTLFRTILFTAALLGLPAISAKSPKRGVCWDESVVKLNSHHSQAMRPGIGWMYNWGPDAADSDLYDSDFRFEPMAWNDRFDESRIRAWLAAHPESRYLLGFNEPNFADQARMTPAQAAAAWPRLEAIAKDFGVKLVAPALNFPNSQVDGRMWNPYEWYDEFFRLYPTATVDFLAMHCYMNWYSATAWLATEYFYADLYNPQKECYGKYPCLVKFLDGYKAANGTFPKMMLTEFCAWENDGTIKNVDFQIDQMTQKLQKLEQSDLIEGYAWFMANDANGASSYPYMSLFDRNSADSDLSDLGIVYVNLSSFDKDRYYAADEEIQAKDYVDATTDDRQIKVRPNTDNASDLPLQIEIPAGAYPDYQIDVPLDGIYKFSFHVNAHDRTALTLYVDAKRDNRIDIPNTCGVWTDVELETSLTSGKHRIMIYNSGDNSVFMNSLKFSALDGVGVIETDKPEVAEIFRLDSVSLGCAEPSELEPGVYVVRFNDGSTAKIRK